MHHWPAHCGFAQRGAVNFDWGYGSPSPTVPGDYFSARWTRQVYFSAGTWTFTATTDDGVRVWVDNYAVIDKWFPQSRTNYSNSIYLAAGYHQVRVEYFEVTGVAVCIVVGRRDRVSATEYDHCG